jgi:hypothetical protein
LPPLPVPVNPSQPLIVSFSAIWSGKPPSPPFSRRKPPVHDWAPVHPQSTAVFLLAKARSQAWGPVWWGGSLLEFNFCPPPCSLDFYLNICFDLSIVVLI